MESRGPWDTTAAMFSIEHNVGRLVEIAIWSPVTAAEAGPWAALHDRVVAGVGGPYLCLVDLSGATVFPPDAVDAYLATMRNEPQLLRTATLLGRSPTLHLQIARMIREASHAQRRAFRDAESVLAFLGEVATPQERSRLEEILASSALRS
jgi:hypothetical protein